MSESIISGICKYLAWSIIENYFTKMFCICNQIRISIRCGSLCLTKFTKKSTNINRPRWTRITCMLFRILQIFLIVKTSFWNEKRSTHSKGFYIKKIKAEVVLFMKSALFVSKSDSHERRSTNIFKISTSVARTSARYKYFGDWFHVWETFTCEYNRRASFESS